MKKGISAETILDKNLTKMMRFNQKYENAKNYLDEIDKKDLKSLQKRMLLAEYRLNLGVEIHKRYKTKRTPVDWVLEFHAWLDRIEEPKRMYITIAMFVPFLFFLNPASGLLIFGTSAGLILTLVSWIATGFMLFSRLFWLESKRKLKKVRDSFYRFVKKMQDEYNKK